MSTLDFTTELDRIGVFVDELVLPMLAGWAIYLAKRLLMQLAGKLGPGEPDK